jgi:hypothetical protein
MRLQNRPHLVDGILVCALRQPDEHAPAGDEHVAAVDRPRRIDPLQRTIAANHLGDGLSLGAARRRTRAHHDGDFVQHHGGVLDEYRIGQIRRGLDSDNRAAGFFERALVVPMLRARQSDIEELTSRVIAINIWSFGYLGIWSSFIHWFH